MANSKLRQWTENLKEIKEVSTRKEWNDSIDTMRCKRQLLNINTTLTLSDIAFTLRNLAFIIIDDISKQYMHNDQNRVGMLAYWRGVKRHINFSVRRKTKHENITNR